MKYSSMEVKGERKEWDEKAELPFLFRAYYMISQYAAGKGQLQFDLSSFTMQPYTGTLT